MNAIAHFQDAAVENGFEIPAVSMPVLCSREGMRLSMDQEQAFGYSVLSMTLEQIQAMACDLDVVSQMVSDMEDAFTKEGKAEKAVALVRVNGLWVRHGTIDGQVFTGLAKDRLEAIRACVDSMSRLDAGVRDLFYVEELKGLRYALAQIIPYDIILTKAHRSFRERYADLSNACRELVRFVATEMYVGQRAVFAICDQFWLSSKLANFCASSNRYVQSIMPINAKREFRAGVINRQRRIARAALQTNVPVAELLGSWSSFNSVSQRIDRACGAFAQVNAGLAEKVAREYRFVNDYDEVRSAAYQGLTRAISLYAPEKGMKFSTYAVTWIKQTILRSIIQQELIRLPEGSHRMLSKARAIYADLPNASDEYVCKAAGINQFELDGLRPYLSGNGALSMDSMTGVDGEETGLHAMIADENGDFVTELEEESTTAKVLEIATEHLDERMLFVLVHRTGLGGADIYPVAELAEKFDTSPQNISRIEKKAQAVLAAIPEMQSVWASML